MFSAVANCLFAILRRSRSRWVIPLVQLHRASGGTKTVINGVTVYRMFHNNDFWIEDGAGHSSHERRMQKIKQQWNFNVERQFEQVLDDFKRTC